MSKKTPTKQKKPKKETWENFWEFWSHFRGQKIIIKRDTGFSPSTAVVLNMGSCYVTVVLVDDVLGKIFSPSLYWRMLIFATCIFFPRGKVGSSFREDVTEKNVFVPHEVMCANTIHQIIQGIFEFHCKTAVFHLIFPFFVKINVFLHGPLHQIRLESHRLKAVFYPDWSLSLKRKELTTGIKEAAFTSDKHSATFTFYLFGKST